ncbi:MAG: hypothetical protein ABW204_09650 [Microbacteriaceae bacterium]
MAELRVTSGGIAAETAPMLEQALRLQRAAGRLAESGRGLHGASGTLRAMGGATAVAANRIDEARTRCTAAAEEAHRIAEALRAAAGNYGAAEQGSSAAVTALAAMLAGQLGRVAPFLLALGAGPGRVAGLLAAVAAGQAAPWVLIAAAITLSDPERRRDVLAGLEAIGPKVLSDPSVVAALRLAVQSSDDFLMGWAQVPGPVRQLVGEQGLGLVDARDTAAWLLGVGGAVGLLRETPVAVAQQRTQTVAPARTIEERVGRIPYEGDGNQIRVERFADAGGEPRFEVYIGPTLSASLETGDEPFDPASIVSMIAGADAGSLRAVEQALADAGARPGDPVLATGYSQGGQIAAALAEQSDFDVQGILTVGAPAANIAVPEETTWLALQHDDDWLAGAGGEPGEQRAIVVERTALPEGFAFGGDAAPAHDLDRYAETAAMADRHGDATLGAAVAEFEAFGASASSREATTYRARRVEE